MISLPQELLDAIIDQVDDRATLHSCALVSDAFIAPSQRNIFRALYIGRRSLASTRGRLRAAAALFTESPYLASYIRDLTIDMPDTPSKLAAWTTVLSLLRNVERLIVTGKDQIAGDEAMSTLLVFLARVGSTLRSLHLLNIRRAPAALVFAATTIPIVSFFRVDVFQTPNLDAHIPNALDDAPPRMRYLTLTNSGSAVIPLYESLLQEPSYTSRVERLELRMDPFSRGGDERLLAACAPTLRYLVIDPGALPQPLGIPHLPLVRVLEIKVFVDLGRRLPVHFPETFARLAAELPLLEHIRLIFVAEPLFPEIPWPDGEPLAGLCLSFEDRSELLHLRGVQCTLQRRNLLPGSMEELFAWFVPAMEARMPGLRGTGILDCALVNPPPPYLIRLP